MKNMATGSKPEMFEAVLVDLRRLHESWMGIVFPRQRDTEHAVLGKWTPRTRSGWIKYRFWGALGALFLVVTYPFAVVGLATRFYARRVDRSAASLGLVGVVLLSLAVWGGLTVLARLRFSYEGFIAVAAAGGVATVAAVLAMMFSKIGGRFTTVFLAYPFGVTALFLPPVVAALYSPVLADLVFTHSTVIAIWLLDNVLHIGGLSTYLRSEFDLVGLAYVGMWFGMAVPVGWYLGILVTLANVIRPTQRDDTT